MPWFSLTFDLTFDDLRAAEEAVHNLDRARLFGRELEVEFAQGDRKSLWPKIAIKDYD